MDDKQIWNIVWNSALSIMAFLGTLVIKWNQDRLDDHTKRIDDNLNRITAVEKLVAGDYMTRQEFVQHMESMARQLDNRLQRIENKLDKL